MTVSLNVHGINMKRSLNTGWEYKRCRYLEVRFNRQMSKLQCQLNYRHSSTADTTTGCFRQCLPTAVRIGHYKNAVIRGAQRGQKLTLTYTILGAFAKLGKATVSCVMSVCLCASVRPLGQLGPHSTDFREIWYFSFFRKCVEKIQFSLIPDKNNGYFTWKSIFIYDNTRRHGDHSPPSADEPGLVSRLRFVI
jgi:hypothetical protein